MVAAASRARSKSLAGSVQRIGRGDLDTALPRIRNPLEVGGADRGHGPDARTAQGPHRGARGPARGRAAAGPGAGDRAADPAVDAARRRCASPWTGATRSPPRCGRPARSGATSTTSSCSDERRLVFAIADVADKGVPAALLMARVTGLFRAIAPERDRSRGILRELDARLSQGNDACMFVTAACGQLDGETGEVRYASAGHERPMLRRVDGTTGCWPRRADRPSAWNADGPYPAVDRAPRSGRRPRPLHGRGHRGVRRGRRGLRPGAAPAGRGRYAGRRPRLPAAIGWWTPSSGSPSAEDRATTWRCSRCSTGRPTSDGAAPAAASGGGCRSRAHRKTWLARSGGSRGSCSPGTCPRRPFTTACWRPRRCWRTSRRTRTAAGRARGRRRDPAARRGDPDPIRGRRAAVQSPRAAGAGRRGTHRHASRRRARHLPGPAARGPLRVRPRGIDQHPHRALPRPAAARRETFTQVQEPLTGGGTMALAIEITDQEPGGRRVMLRGRLDTLTAPQLETALAPLLDSSAVTSIVFGLDGLEYISSAGIRCLVRAHKALGARGGRVVIVNPQPVRAQGAGDRQSAATRAGLRQRRGARRLPRCHAAEGPGRHVAARPPRRGRPAGPDAVAGRTARPTGSRAMGNTALRLSRCLCRRHRLFSGPPARYG